MQHIILMAKFLDVHSFHSLDESTVKELQRSPPDEFGVKHHISTTKGMTCVFVNLKCDYMTQP
jgi:hypothetical protein